MSQAVMYEIKLGTYFLQSGWFMSLAPERYGSNFESVISKHMFGIKVKSISCDIALGWMPQNTFD